MQRVLPVLVTLAWALWFGGIVMVFVTVMSLSATFAARREDFGAAAAGVFGRFEVFQLALAAAALLATLAWRMLSARSRLKTALLACFAAATVLAVVGTTTVTPRIEAMRARGEIDAQRQRFGMLHGISSSIYLGEAVVLLVAGLLLPAAIFRDRPAGQAPTPAEARAASSPTPVPVATATAGERAIVP